MFTYFIISKSLYWLKWNKINIKVNYYFFLVVFFFTGLLASFSLLSSPIILKQVHNLELVYKDLILLHSINNLQMLFWGCFGVRFLFGLNFLVFVFLLHHKPKNALLFLWRFELYFQFRLDILLDFIKICFIQLWLSCTYNKWTQDAVAISIWASPEAELQHH